MSVTSAVSGDATMGRRWMCVLRFRVFGSPPSSSLPGRRLPMYVMSGVGEDGPVANASVVLSYARDVASSGGYVPPGRLPVVSCTMAVFRVVVVTRVGGPDARLFREALSVQSQLGGGPPAPQVCSYLRPDGVSSFALCVVGVNPSFGVSGVLPGVPSLFLSSPVSTFVSEGGDDDDDVGGGGRVTLFYSALHPWCPRYIH